MERTILSYFSAKMNLSDIELDDALAHLTVPHSVFHPL